MDTRSPDRPTATADAFRDLMANWPTGVAVITATDDEGPFGLASNSFASVSLEPTLVAWSVGCTSSNVRHQHSRGRPRGPDRRFARRGGDKFAGLTTTPGSTGSPLLSGCAGVLECRSWARHDAGDHTLLLGEVVSLHPSSTPALVQRRRAAG